ncbi:MAG: hypothetical protein CR979_02045, partial [Propionibacterium sp.]
ADNESLPQGSYDPNGPVFISYRRSDGHRYAMLLDTLLRAGGLTPWRDLVALPPGENAVRVKEAMKDGISAAVLVVTKEIKNSTFISKIEVRDLVKLDKEKNSDFSLFVANTIRADEYGEIDYEQPDKLISGDHGLRYAKQYALLEERSELRQLLADLLRQKFRAIAPELKERELRIYTSKAATNSTQRHDFTIRLRPDSRTEIPEELGYRCFQQALPIFTESLYSHDFSKVRLSGFGQFSVDWALAAALSPSRLELGNFSVQDPNGNIWEESLHHRSTKRRCSVCGQYQPDQRTFKVKVKRLKFSSGPLHEECRETPPKMAVMFRLNGKANMTAFNEMVSGLSGCTEAIAIDVIGRRGADVIPEAEGFRLAREMHRKLVEYSHNRSAELHIASNLPVALTTLCARRTTNLNCVLHELGRDLKTGGRRYYPTIRVQAGEPNYPISEVFPQFKAQFDPNTVPVKELVNLSPQPVSIYDEENEQVITWPAVVEDDWLPVDEVANPSVSVSHNETAVNLTTVNPAGDDQHPPRVPGRGYIVPRLTALSSCRDDFFFPYGEVRNDNGDLLGARSLGQAPASPDSFGSLLPLLVNRAAEKDEGSSEAPDLPPIDPDYQPIIAPLYPPVQQLVSPVTASSPDKKTDKKES